MKDNKQKGLTSLFITIVVMVFLGFLAFNVLQGGKHSNVTKVTHTAEETTITSAESSVSGESTSNGESTKASENSSADKSKANNESSQSGESSQAEPGKESESADEKKDENGKSSKFGMGKIKLGLDLAGGVSITYQTVQQNPSDEDMADTIYKLQQRVQNYSTEAEVYREGGNRINIDIPGVSDANAILDELGKPGSLLFVDPQGQTVLTGDQVATAKAGIIDNNGKSEYVVSLTFTDEGSKAFAEATAKLIGQRIAIIYDNVVYSNPTVQTAITGGNAQITGMTSYDEAKNLASTIRIGSLSLELEELRSNVVGAKLGQTAISTSMKAAVVGFVVLAAFMIGVFLLPGAASVIALALYIILEILLLSAFEITLTLPGIAGIILSIGMAVDANVIIFTRIKEEIALGKSVYESINSGFKKALSAIIDGNVTTLIAAAVLYVRGSGTVKGFAQTLALGIILSMFTALFVTKFILKAFYNVGLDDVKFYGKKPDRESINFVGMRKITLSVAAVVLIIGVIFAGVNKSQIGGFFNYGLDFKGGTSTNVTFNKDYSLEEISKEIVPVVESVTGEAGTQTQKVQGTNQVIIKTRSLSLDEREKLNKALADKFGVDAEKITAESISGAVSSEMKKDAVVATVLATILMLIYIWIRFRDFSFAAGSILALLHDVFIVISCYAIFRWSVGSTFIACILTILGYSINATIVIFDRIRENKSILPKSTAKEELINKSVTETLTRSIYSSLTTFITIFILFLMGVPSIREFALPIMVGIVAGTYSSVFLSSVFWYLLSNKFDKKIEEKKAENAKKKKKTKKVEINKDSNGAVV
ncbi:export membrane protein SecF [Lachnoanaerobaculum saburreum F0468]|jgi:protein-export membrane protein, secD/secF family|uniref:Multifunctional fusion protein n=1 Tax=Lachnoanaerobaculum saburreum F0468 TaxID=1095750 RepID=I0R7Y3_9FIRM|nr:protein translocase subunit SecDF [Lachnoanaerobaculum saburreum]EIC95791.1 export membrane protein SecF [Lachnoanaerobaculum saburreum F0468]